MSYLTQMLALAVQNFVSAATGMAVLVALVRGFVRKEAGGIGSFWVDLVRSTVYILLPLSIIFSSVLVSQGVPQTFDKYATATLVQPVTYDNPKNGPDGQAEPATHALGRSVGGFSTKIYARCEYACEGAGTPITFAPTIDQQHEAMIAIRGGAADSPAGIYFSRSWLKN